MIKWSAFLFSFAVYVWNDVLRTWEHIAFVQRLLHRDPFNLDVVRSLLSGPKLGFVLIEHQSKFFEPRRVYWQGQNRQIQEYTPTQAETPGTLARRPVEFFDYAAFTWHIDFKKWEHECYAMRTQDDQLIRDIVRSLAREQTSPLSRDSNVLRYVAIEKQNGFRGSRLESWAPVASVEPVYEFWVGSRNSEPRPYQPKQKGMQNNGKA